MKSFKEYLKEKFLKVNAHPQDQKRAQRMIQLYPSKSCIPNEHVTLAFARSLHVVIRMLRENENDTVNYRLIR